MNIDLRLGDCLEVLKTLPDNSVDSVITDPPYHLTSIVKRFGKDGSAPAQFGTDGAYARASKGFMGKEWDGGDIAFRTEVWEECLRVLKPGGHLISFSHSRTYHRMAVAVEDAGFEIRDQILWLYGSGFPKSHNIGKSIDKIEGNEREVVGTSNGKGYSSIQEKNLEHDNRPYVDGLPYLKADRTLTKGNSEWEGWGTALKPAHEPMVLARKPLSEKSIAENVLKHGTGGINIDGSRIEYVSDYDKKHQEDIRKGTGTFFGGEGESRCEQIDMNGRFPANIIFDEEAGQLLDEQSGISKSGKNKLEKGTGGIWNKGTNLPIGPEYGDKGGASRFFYCAKASKKDRNEGLDNEPNKTKNRVNSGGLENDPRWAPIQVKNNHPTVKPTDLMRYLINLITPPNGVVLDPFMGSGSTGKAAIRCGVSFIGIEKEQEYMDIAKARIEHEKNKPIQGKLL